VTHFRFREARPVARVIHLDSAAAGRSSIGTLRAVAAHAELEAETGAYSAQASAAPVIADGRAALAGLLGAEPEGVAFTESASAALDSLLSVWPLSPGDVVAVVPSEWGPNLDAFAHRGLRIVSLPVASDGTVELDGLRRFLADTPPAFVHLTQVASHRPLVHPVASAAEICRAAGVPLWVDAAQALGHADTACGADAIYSTSRKWMTGPRGVGVLAVARPWWDRLRIVPSGLQRMTEVPSPVRFLEAREAHVAGWVGLAHAVREHLDAGPSAVRERLAAVGKLTRAMLSDVPGWELVSDVAAPSAITALRPVLGQDVARVRARLLSEHRIVTTAAYQARAPRDMKSAYLRVSPHADCVEEDLVILRDALMRSSRK
jgi:pyridoxal 5-phosphate dependent beta-lyase